MNEQNREKSLVRKLVALLAAAAVGLGITLTGCAPQDTEEPATPEDSAPEEPAMPDESAPEGNEGTAPPPMPESENNNGE